MSDPRLDAAWIKGRKALAPLSSAVDSNSSFAIAFDIVKAIAEAPEPTHNEYCSREYGSECDCGLAWWKAARVLVEK